MKNYLIGASVIILLILVFVGCHRCGHVDTTIVRDTVIVHDTLIKTYTPQLTNTTSGKVPAVVQQKAKPIVPQGSTDTLYVYDKADIDSLLQLHYAHNFYSDTQHTKYGDLVINDTVTENRIRSRNLIADFKIPVVTTTITTVQPKKLKAYVTLSLMGNATNYLQAVGIGGMVQFKNDNALEVSAFINRVVPLPAWSTMDYQLSYKHKISFTKN